MIRLLCVLGHGHELLPHFIEHYTKYVDELQFVIYESKASPRILSRAKPIIEKYNNCKIVKVVREREFDWEKVTILYNMFKSKKKNDWWVIADIDEFHLYPNNNLETLIDDCEKNLWSIVRGGFIDRVGPDGSFPMIPKEGTSIFKTFPMAGFFRHPMSGACPNKVAISRGDVKITNGQHYAEINGQTTWRWQGWGHPLIAPPETHSVQVHHFKWDETCGTRIKSVADLNEKYSYSKEYYQMYDQLKKNNFKINTKIREYFFLKCEEGNFKEYKHWNKLMKKITSI